MKRKQQRNVDTARPFFTRLASLISIWSGRSSVFFLACAAVVLWLVTGPLFGFSDTWQLVINTGTTIVTFLMVFLIQNTQNRDTRAMQLKLDELIRATEGAHNAILDLEELSEEELIAVRDRYENLASDARKHLRQGQVDTDIPTINITGRQKTSGATAQKAQIRSAELQV